MPRTYTTVTTDSPLTTSPLTTLWAKLGLAMAGVCWVALSSTLCGCGTASGFAMNETGRGYFKSGNYTAAAAAFSRATLDDPSNPNYAYNLAKAMHKQGNLTAAEHQYRRALAIDPRHQPTYNGLASLMQESGREAEANGLLSSWAATQPHLPAAHIELAALQRKQGDLGAAEQSLRQALSTDPTNTIALAHMGELMQQKGDTTNAASYYRQSLAKNPFQSRVESRLAAVSQPPSRVVRQASYAPAPEMIAGRANPSFVPPAATHKPVVPFGAPPYTPVAFTTSPYVPNQRSSTWIANATPYRMGPMNYLRSNGATYQPAWSQGQPVASYTTPGVGTAMPFSSHSVQGTFGSPSSQSSYVTYQLPTGAQGLGGTQVSGVFPTEGSLPTPMWNTTAPAHSTAPLGPLPAPSLAAPSMSAPSLPAPSLVAPSGIVPATHTTTGHSAGVEQIQYTTTPVVPAF